MNRALSLVALASVCLGLWGCSQPLEYAGGSGADVETKVVGSAVDTAGNPVAGVPVHLRQGSYVFPIQNIPPVNGGQSFDAFTDESGGFRFDSVHPGSYVVEINNQKGLAAVVRFTAPDSSAMADLGNLALVRTCVVRGTLPAELRAGKQWFVQIYGLERVASVDQTSGTYSFSDIPAGRFSFRLMTTSPDVGPIVTDTCATLSGDTLVAPTYPAWRYSRKLTLNTTAAGAEIPGDVMDFPVLIRLTSDNFNFSLAQAGGRDLRFTRADGTPLPFEIERWDAVNGAAAVWVKVDTVHGNNDSQYLLMLWGNPAAIAHSDPAMVFDTTAGFVGVWHLGQPSDAIVPDATANNIGGTATATVTVNGAVGMAQSFDGASSFIQAAGPNDSLLNFPENGNYSVSAWVKATAIDSLYHGIVYKSNFQYGLQIRPENRWEFFTYIDRTGWDASYYPTSVGDWHALSGIRRGTRQYLYVDGTCVDSSAAVNTVVTSRVTDAPFQIGHCPDGGLNPGRYFNGVIDEVRISRKAISADWIKLCFMNQKDRDALVKWQ